MKQSLVALVFISFAAVLTACNGNNSVTAPPGTGTNCGGPPSANQVEVLFPRPNSRNAPSNVGNIYIASKGQLAPNNSWNFLLVQSNGGQTFTGPFTGISKSSLPPGSASPTYPNAVYYASAIAGPYGSGYIIGPNQSVSLFWNDGGTGCTPHFLVSSFRTKR
ncbi:MAG TPA: hypothetical protein VGI19_10755 [Candidatus Cybelea sp.]